MSDEDILFHFMKGLQLWVQMDLHCQSVQTLAIMMSMRDKLLDYRVDEKYESKRDDHGSIRAQGIFKKKMKWKPKLGGKHENKKDKSAEQPK